MRLVALGAAGLIAGAVAGVAVPALAEWTERGSTTVAAVATSLDPAGVDVVVSPEREATVTVTPPATGAVPSTYLVTRDAAEVCGWTPEVSITAPVTCADNDLPPATSVSYAVTVAVGSWSRSSTPVTRAVPPVTPGIELAADSDTGIPDGLTTETAAWFQVTAAAGTNPYDVLVTRDGVVVETLAIPKEGGTPDVEIPLDEGRPHSVSAYAVYEGAASPPSAAIAVRHVPTTSVTSVTLDDRVDLENVGPPKKENRYDIAGRDEMVVTYSSPIQPQSICAGWDGATALTVTARIQSSGRQSVMSFVPAAGQCGGQVVLGSITFSKGGNSKQNTSPMDFTSTSLSLSSDGTRITVSLGPFADTHVWRMPNDEGGRPSATYVPGPVLDRLGNETSLGAVTATGTF
jgi:hypothetical protein